MNAYITFLVLVSIEYFLLLGTVKDKVKGKKRFTCLFLIELVLLMGMRAYNIGADTEWYLYYLEKNKGVSLNQIPLNTEYYEYGYSLFNNLCSYLNLDKTTFLLVVSAIEVVPFFIFVSKYSQNLFLSIIVFMAFQPFNLCMGMFRQAIAISIFFLGIGSIFEKNLKRFCIFIIIASFFHTSILFLFPLYWLGKIKIKKEMVFFVPIVTAVFVIFGRVISHYIVSKSHYNGYLDSKYDTTENGTQLLTLVFLAISVLCILSIRNHSDSGTSNLIDEKLNLSIWACMLLCMCQPLVYNFVLFNRVTAALSYFLPICIPNICNITKEEKGKMYLTVGLVVFMILFCYRQIGSNIYINDYSFYWEV